MLEGNTLAAVLQPKWGNFLETPPLQESQLGLRVWSFVYAEYSLLGLPCLEGRPDFVSGFKLHGVPSVGFSGNYTYSPGDRITLFSCPGNFLYKPTDVS